MDTKINLSKAQQRILDRQKKIVLSYLDAKSNKLNISDWKIRIAEEMQISIHAVDYNIRPAQLKRILEFAESTELCQ